MLSGFISRMENDYWNKINIYWSEKKVKRQIFLELFLNNLISYIIALPLVFGLILLVKQIFNPNIFKFEFYLPLSFFILTFLFFGCYFLIIYYFIIKNYNQKGKIKENVLQALTINPRKKSKNIFIILVILMGLPILNIISYFILINFYNPFLTTYSIFLDEIVNFISLFYSIIIISIIILIIPNLIIKFVQFFSKIPFAKLKNQKYDLLKKFYQYKYLSTLMVIGILSLEIGFLNFYHFRNVNQNNQEEFEIYLKYGSDFKIFEPYTRDKLINLSYLVKSDYYCLIKAIPGKIISNIIIDQDIVLLSFNPNKYYSVLNEKCQSKIDLELISRIENLESNEILVPRYLNLKYNLKIGDLIVIHPQNASNYNSELIESLEKRMYIRGYFNLLPGLDQETIFYNTPFSEKGMIIIANSNFNYSSMFPELPISGTNLIKNVNDSVSIINSLIYNNSEIKFTSLQNDLDKYYNSYAVVSSNSISTMYWVFVIIFLFMTILILLNFIIENDDSWNLFQLFSLTKKNIKKFILWGLIGIFIFSFLIGLFGIFGGFLLFIIENVKFKFNYYIYPIHFYFAPIGLFYNSIYIISSIFIIWLISNKIIKFDLNYEKLRKYNPE